MSISGITGKGCHGQGICILQACCICILEAAVAAHLLPAQRIISLAISLDNVYGSRFILIVLSWQVCWLAF